VSGAGQFLAARRAAGQLRVRTMQTLARLFGYLCGRQVLPLEQPAVTPPLDEPLARHRCYLARDRCVTPLTRLSHGRMSTAVPAPPTVAARGRPGMRI
jgi:hypothetical protein